MGGEKKTTEELREEICEEFNWTEEDNKDKIDKVLELKKDRYTATQAKKKAKKDVEKTKTHFKTLAEKAKEEAKKAGKTGKQEPKGKITSDDKSYLFSKNIIKSRTEMRHLEKVMGLTGKSWEKAIADNSFITFRKNNDKLITRRGSQLGASRGGSTAGDGDTQAKITAELSKDLPPGLAKLPEKK